MRNVDIYGLIILTIFMGGLFTFLGWVIKSQNAADMLNGFDAKIYDKDKASRIVGSNMLNTGLLIILIGVISILLDAKLYNYIISIQVCLVILSVIRIIYDIDKKCRIKK